MRICTTSNGYRFALDSAQPGILLRQKAVGEWVYFLFVDGDYDSPQALMAWLGKYCGEVFAGHRVIAWEGNW